MSFLSAVFSWMHLLCDWSMSNGVDETNFLHFELRNLSIKQPFYVAAPMKGVCFGFCGLGQTVYMGIKSALPARLIQLAACRIKDWALGDAPAV